MEPTVIRVSEPRELLALVPYQLGFVPQDSAVLISLRGPRRAVGLIARTDLGELAGRPEGPALAEAMVSHLLADGAVGAALVLYTATGLRHGQGDGSPERVAAQTLYGALRAAGLAVDGWVVGPSGYYGLDCRSESCCPPGGHPLRELDETQIGALMVLRGVQVAPSREQLARIEPAGTAERRAAAVAARRWWRLRDDAVLGGAGGELARWRLAGVAAWRQVVRAVSDDDRAPAALCGRVAAALDDTAVRDAVLLAALVDDGDLAERSVGDDALTGAAFDALLDEPAPAMPDQRHLDLGAAALRQVVRHCTAPARQAPALTVLSFLAWWSGDGAQASLFADRALAARPGYTMAGLVAELLARGVPPGWVTGSRPPRTG